METQLSENVEKINRLHDILTEGLKKSVEMAIKIGGLLEDQKKLVGHGNWIQWVDDNCHFSIKTCQRYLSLNTYKDKFNQVGSLQDAYRMIEDEKKKAKVVEKIVQDGEKPEVEPVMEDEAINQQFATPDGIKDIFNEIKKILISTDYVEIGKSLESIKTICDEVITEIKNK